MTTTIVTRAGKGSALTNTELDANFSNLQTTADNANLAAFSAVTGAADKVFAFTGAGAGAVYDFTSVGRTLVAQTTQALMRTTGLGMTANGSSLVSATDYAAMKTLLAFTATDVGLGSVENKSSATIRGEITSSNVTSALGYTPTSITSYTGSVSIATLKSAFSLTASDVGLGSVENKSSSTIRGEITSSNVNTALGGTVGNMAFRAVTISSSSASGGSSGDVWFKV